jgi:hypothetical protein
VPTQLDVAPQEPMLRSRAQAAPSAMGGTSSTVSSKVPCGSVMPVPMALWNPPTAMVTVCPAMMTPVLSRDVSRLAAVMGSVGSSSLHA